MTLKPQENPTRLASIGIARSNQNEHDLQTRLAKEQEPKTVQYFLLPVTIVHPSLNEAFCFRDLLVYVIDI